MAQEKLADRDETGSVSDAAATEMTSAAAHGNPGNETFLSKRPRKEGSARQTTRRAFIGMFGISATIVALGGIGALTSRNPLLRPPGGQDERSFLAGCNHCGRCIEVCHTSAIGPAHLSEGLIEARTPVMRFNLGPCDFCGDCVEVCPTGALRPFDTAAAQMGDPSACRIGIASLDQNTCLAWTSSSCNLCFERCPYDAIFLDGNLPVVNESACNGCGICENVCPVLSLRSYIGGTTKAIVVVPAENHEEVL